MKGVDEIARECGCRHTSAFPHPDRGIDICSVIHTLDTMYQRYGDKVVLYGGQLATPWFFGYKQMRTTTTDVDLAVSPEILKRVIREYSATYHDEYRVFYSICDSIPFVFTAEKIHDWRIPEDFYTSATLHKFGSFRVRGCSREYLITLKLRRIMESDHSLFGKDAIDILNILTASVVRKELGSIDYMRCSELIKLYIQSDISSLIARLYSYTKHVAAHDRDICNGQLNQLKQALKGE